MRMISCFSLGCSPAQEGGEESPVTLCTRLGWSLWLPELEGRRDWERVFVLGSNTTSSPFSEFLGWMFVHLLNSFRAISMRLI
jgi:hypothetical protein